MTGPSCSDCLHCRASSKRFVSDHHYEAVFPEVCMRVNLPTPLARSGGRLYSLLTNTCGERGRCFLPKRIANPPEDCA